MGFGKGMRRVPFFGIWRSIPPVVHALVAALPLLLLCSCATGYHPLRGQTGFSEIQIKPDQFQITFRGNADTSSDRVHDFALLRAAQVARQHGFDWFSVEDVTNESTVHEYFITSERYAAGIVDPLYPSFFGSSGSGSFVSVQEKMLYHRPGVTLLVQGHATKPEHRFAYEAAVVDRELRRKHKVRG
jgi:hypothetical protein